ncbi:glycoside hydrolase family 31 protein [Ohtaekwangia sp.]|uniref:glycoside hydrolase family 31 protein n=1 Tax=Ohtaekwangia sp. TaxID=2066019 RepID=UPI002FDDED8B
MKQIYHVTAMLLSLFVIGCTSKNYEQTELGVKTRIDSTVVEIQFITPKIVRVLKYPLDSAIHKTSLSVIKKPETVDFKIAEDGHTVSVASDAIKVLVDIKTGSISYSKPDGSTLLQEKAGTSAFKPFNDAGSSTYSVSQTFTLERDEAIYGLGILQNGKMSQRNQNVKMIQANTWDYIPFFQSAKGYGLFWDNYSPTTFSDDSTGTQFYSEVGNCIDYYLMYGENADGVIARMRELTGSAPMFPLWTYGFWQSRERYKSQKEIVDVVKKYRALQVPLDGIIQDWQYWGDNYHWNAMEFLNEEFPKPQQMVDEIHRQNAHIIISIWSSFGPKTRQYEELKAKGMLLDFLTWPLSAKDVWPPDMNFPSGVRPYDPYNPEARDIYWKYLNTGLFSMGMDGWWMDSTEPDHMEFKPEDLDLKTHLGSFRKVRNAYPLMTVGGVYEHQRKVTADKRVFILTRSAFAGQQRFGSNTWSGDIVASWKALANQIPAGLNFSLCGIPYWNCDLGGFFLWEFDKKLDDAEYRELYTRWLEFGTFCPMMRSHGADAPREIYQFGKKGDKVYDAIEKFINLRYSLLPYSYSTAWQVTHEHSSMMRALVMDFASDRKTHNINDQFMFGKSLMIAPVTTPMYFKEVIQKTDTVKVEDFSRTGSEKVYLPSGTSWFDFWTNEKHNGGDSVEKNVPLDIIPVYVKSGSIIPFGPKVQYATEKDWTTLDIRVYTGQDGSFTLYEDENDNYNYEQGAYSLINFTWDDKNRKLVIDKREGKFDGMLVNRSFQIIVIDGQGNPVLKKVDYSGERIILEL